MYQTKPMPSYIIGHTIRQSAGSGLHIEQGLSATCILVSQDLAVRFADETLNRGQTCNNAEKHKHRIKGSRPSQRTQPKGTDRGQGDRGPS